jgi:hypothetical protein
MHACYVRAMRALGPLLALTILLAGCGAGESVRETAARPASASPATHLISAGHAAGRHRRRRTHTASKVHQTDVCPSTARALDGVYHPSRLRILSTCRHAAGVAASVRHEPDGDLHVDVAVDPPYRYLLAPANREQQHGDLVVEFMARDGGHLPEPHVGDRIKLVGAWVDDTQHGWNELHPVWAVSLNSARMRTSGAQFGGSPPGDRSYDAAGDCRSPSGARCRGYGGGGSGDRPLPPRVPTPPSSGGAGAGGCEPGYTPCLPRVSDLNCSEIPAEKKPVRVTGSDPYRLDADHNGIGCQSG